MLRTIAPIALLLLLSNPADARRDYAQQSNQNLCGKCLELDNETLPDKHYFPSGSEGSGASGASTQPHAFMFEDASTIAEHLWNPRSLHAVADSHTVTGGNGNSRANSDKRHGDPSLEPSDVKDAQWAWGGLRECSRGPEGKISAGCHQAQYDNLLCNSHYDDCDDERFAQAFAAVLNNDAKTLRTLIRHEGSSVIVNKKRVSIQLLGCSGDIVGNLPISRDLLREIL